MSNSISGTSSYIKPMSRYYQSRHYGAPIDKNNGKQDKIDDIKEKIRLLIDETFSATDEKAYELWKKIEQL